MYIMAILLIVPIIFKICHSYFNYLEKQLQTKIGRAISDEQISWEEIDSIMRFDLFQISDCKQLNLQQIQVLQIIKQQKEKELFDEEENCYFDDQIKLNEDNKLKQYLEEEQYILKTDFWLKQKFNQIMLKKYLQNQKDQKSQFYFSFFTFLIQKNKNLILYMIQNENLLKLNQYSAKERQIFSTINKFFEKEKYFIEKKLGQNSPFSETFIDQIIYEEQVDSLKDSIQFVIKQKIKLIEILQNKKIEVKNLMNQFDSYLTNIYSIRKQLQGLYKINNTNKQLVELQKIYLSNLSFSDKDIYQTRVIDLNKYLCSKKIKQNGCIIFAHQIKNEWVIKKTSSILQSIFQYKEQDLIGQNVTMLMPQIFRAYHNKYVEDFLGMNTEDVDIKMHQNKTLFGIKSSGFVFPVKLEVRVNQYFEEKFSSFGLAANIFLADSNIQYILFNTTNLGIIGITEKLSYSLFKNIKNIQQYKINQFFTFINQKNKNSTFIKSQEQSGYNQEQQIVISQQNKIHYNFQNKEQFYNTVKQYLAIFQKQQPNDLDSRRYQYEQANKTKYQFFQIQLKVIKTEHKYNKNIEIIQINSVIKLSVKKNSYQILTFILENHNFYENSIGKLKLDELMSQLHHNCQALQLDQSLWLDSCSSRTIVPFDTPKQNCIKESPFMSSIENSKIRARNISSIQLDNLQEYQKKESLIKIADEDLTCFISQERLLKNITQRERGQTEFYNTPRLTVTTQVMTNANDDKQFEIYPKSIFSAEAIASTKIASLNGIQDKQMQNMQSSIEMKYPQGNSSHGLFQDITKRRYSESLQKQSMNKNQNNQQQQQSQNQQKFFQQADSQSINLEPTVNKNKEKNCICKFTLKIDKKKYSYFSEIQKNSKFNLVISIIGFIFFLITFSLSLFQYLNSTFYLDKSYKNWQYMNFEFQYSEANFQIIGNTEVECFINQLNLNKSSSWKIHNTDFILNYINLSKVHQTQFINQQLQLLQEKGSQVEQFKILQDAKIKIIETNRFFSQFQIQSSDNKNIFQRSFSSTLLYSLMHSQLGVFQYGVQNQFREYEFIANQLQIDSTIFDIKTIDNQNQKQNQDNEYQQILVTLILILICAFIGILLLLPINYYVQTLKQQVLQLFGTFPVNELENFKQNLTDSISKSQILFTLRSKKISIASEFKDNYSIQNIKLNKQNEKARNSVRHYSQLPKWNFKLLLKMLTLLLWITLIPFISFLSSSKFFEYQSQLYEMRYIIHTIKKNIIQLEAMNSLGLNQKVVTNLKNLEINQFRDQIQEIQRVGSSNKQKIQMLINSAQSNNFFIFIFHFQNSFINDEDIQFFQSVLQENVYQTMIQYPQYLPYDNSIEFQNLCSEIEEVYLEKGLVQGFQLFFSLQEEIYNFVFQSNESERELVLINLQKDFNLNNTFILSKCLAISADALEQFILMSYSNYFAIVQNLKKILIILQISFLISSMIFSWLYLISDFTHQINQTFSYFQIFNIDTLSQNSYVLSFLKKYKTKL